MTILKKIISIIVLIILLPILFINIVILIDSYMHPNEIPSFFGFKPFIVLTGSMEAEISAGDLVITKKVKTEDIKKDDIIAFKEDDIIITHRVIDIVQEDGILKYKTKGDNNSSEDKNYVLPEQIEGLYVFKISRLGNFFIFTQTPIGIIICLSIPLGLLFCIQMFESFKNKKYIKENYIIEENLKKEIEELKKQNEELLKK